MNTTTTTMKTQTMKKEKLIFEQEYNGYSVKAWYLKKPNAGDALVNIFQGKTKLREFTFPAYKIYNIAAHFPDIVESEIAGDIKGYEEAASTGFGGSVGIKLI